MAPVVRVFCRRSNPASDSGGASFSPMTAGCVSDNLPFPSVESLVYLRDFFGFVVWL
ncbi:unnamed protein product [Brassica rapa]|uniref:Uncharacterized protein n=2 Tax=Brassica TaxID=3705 RepID=A0A8D9GUW7_BRACM|nr:unnamed protein product [Brassica napus]CAG7887222.1 unnamed protein product [Brassica rapa]